VLGLARARAVLISHGNTRVSANTVITVRDLAKDVPLIARAKNIEQVQRLEGLGATLAVAEMFEASLQLGGALMKELAIPDVEISRILETFRAEDYALTRRAENGAPVLETETGASGV
jgi:monovalent cation:H+ antiporter-2, CPA2 family